MPVHSAPDATGTSPRLRGVVGAVLLGVSLITLLAACASPTSSDAGQTPTPTAQSIVGTWVVSPDQTLATTPFLTIAGDGSWTGSDGCNVVRGTWEVAADGTLVTTSGPSTLIGCDGKPLPALFSNATRATVDGDSLVLQDESGEVVTLVAGREPLKRIVTPTDTPTN